MRILLSPIAIVVAALSGAAAAKPKAPSAVKKPPVPILAAVDVFGSHEVAAADVLAVAGLKLGTPAAFDDPAFNASLAAAQARIEQKWQFAFVRVSPIMYFAGDNAGKTYVTIDLVDRGDEARMTFAPAPTGTIADPDGLIAAWIAYEKTANELLGKGLLDVGKCKGGLHCALGFGHDSIRAVEDTFIDDAPKQFRALCDVLRHDHDERRRAAAAFVLAYGGDAAHVVAALVPSVDDPSGLVRNNVVRVLVMIQQPAAEPVVPLEPILRALQFPEVTDRNKAAYALAGLATTAPDRFRAQILAEAGDTLVEMAALAQPNNRDPAVEILTALAGKDLGSPGAWRAWLVAWRATM